MKKITIIGNKGRPKKISLSVEKGHISVSAGYSKNSPESVLWINGAIFPYYYFNENLELSVGERISICIEQTEEVYFEGICAKKDFGRLLEQYKDLEKRLIDKGVINDERNSTDH